jgi:predicted  nucleic acid-binding Zn-ribbon protein
MNPSIAALVALQSIDRRRLTLRKDRDARAGKIDQARKALAAAQAAAAACDAETEKVQALHRQYQADVARCETQIAAARSQQQAAKTNKEYMAIINGIEQAKSEKALREQSLKELDTRIAGLAGKREAAVATQAAAQAAVTAADTAAGGLDATPEEAAAQTEYDQRKRDVLPEFLEHYERLMKAGHKSPLMAVDPKTRATPVGVVLSHNQCEQIRSGKLVIERMTNAILYLPE